ncbi:MAG: thioredoxin domain-containing protein [Candidatus Nomurabacteria bacterium]|nr:MAG: thioredoxin domain-containing protein [Candidatus Nomurabacteria bacterium]
MTNNYTYIAVAIFLGFAMIAGAILYKLPSPSTNTQQLANHNSPTANLVNLTKDDIVRAEDRHYYGSPEAKITIVEFSDFECPFCSRLHPTLKRIVDESAGDIAWEYRHLPLPNHPNSFADAVASECVSKQLGNDAFWSYATTLFNNQSVHSADFRLKEALALGVDEVAFEQCITDQSISELVQSDLSVATKAGGSGTPYSLVIDSTGKVTPVSGAVPYESWKKLLSALDK